jgi:prevent-host-death family protein
MTTTMTIRAFNQNTGGARNAAAKGPVIITDRGTPSHVLMTYAEYRRLTGKGRSALEALAQPGGEHIEFEPPRLEGPLTRPVDFD